MSFFIFLPGNLPGNKIAFMRKQAAKE